MCKRNLDNGNYLYFRYFFGNFPFLANGQGLFSLHARIRVPSVPLAK
jgi:hypothetical protein